MDPERRGIPLEVDSRFHRKRIARTYRHQWQRVRETDLDPYRRRRPHRAIVIDRPRHQDMRSWRRLLPDKTERLQLSRLRRLDELDARLAQLPPVSQKLDPAHVSIWIARVDHDFDRLPRLEAAVASGLTIATAGTWLPPLSWITTRASAFWPMR